MNKQIKITSKAVASFMFFVLVIGLQEKILQLKSGLIKRTSRLRKFSRDSSALWPNIWQQRKVDGKIRLTEGVNRVSTVAGRSVEMGGPRISCGLYPATEKMVTYFLNRQLVFRVADRSARPSMGQWFEPFRRS